MAGAITWLLSTIEGQLEQISLGSNREDSQRFNNERVCRY
jgi:hypothetical protein